MDYLLLFANDPDGWEDPGPAPGGDDVFGDWDAYTLALHEAGVLRDGAGLHDAEIATSVRVRDGRRVLTDGPFMEAKEHLIGYVVIDVPDLDVALGWAARVPNARTGVVEIRPVRPELTVAATLARHETT